MFATTVAWRESGINVSSTDQIKSGRDEDVEQSEGSPLIRRSDENIAPERQRRDLHSRIA